MYVLYYIVFYINNIYLFTIYEKIKKLFVLYSIACLLIIYLFTINEKNKKKNLFILYSTVAYINNIYLFTIYQKIRSGEKNEQIICLFVFFFFECL